MDASNDAPVAYDYWLWPAIPMVIAALALPIVGGDAPATAAEAAPSLQLWLDTPDGPRPVGDGAVLQPGDRVQATIIAPSPVWVTLVAESSGGVDVHGSWQAVVGAQPAPFVLGLGEVPGEQRVHAVFTSARPSESEVQGAVQAGERVDTVTVVVSAPR